MPEVALRPKAYADLDNIWDYTVETWGFDQAERYVRSLGAAFETLAENPALGRIYNEIYEDLRVYPAGSHLIFYFASVNGIDGLVGHVRNGGKPVHVSPGAHGSDAPELA